jgi:hypothetical protein
MLKGIFNVITQSELKEVLSYDKETGLFTWIKKLGVRTIIGDVISAINNSGYIHVQINKKKYLGHRLVWLYEFGEFPIEFIDHVDGNRANNRLSNLREASNSQNMMNRKVNTNSKLKTKGVCFHKKLNKFQVACQKNGKRIFLGTFDNLVDAKNAYISFAMKAHGEFYRQF